MLKNIRKVLVILMLITVGFGMPAMVLAETTSELQNQKNEIDEKIAETNTELQGVKSKMSTALNQITRLNSQISDYEDEIQTLSGQLDTLNTQITEKESVIKVQEDKFEEQQALLEKRLVALYESGKTTYLDMLLSSEGLSGFISKYYLIGTLAEADEELMNQIAATKQKIEDEKIALEDSKKEVESSKEKINNQKNALSVSVNEKNRLVENLNEDEKALQDKLEEYEQDKREIQSKLAAIAYSSNKSYGIITPVSPSAAGYGTPLAGKTKANITTGYYGYSNHTGVDFACAGGTPILAVKAGIVRISEAKRSASGAYRSYGEYVVIDHMDGTMTLYGHMQSGSRAVSVGQSVSQGQVIGLVGSTGNSTGNHLHFEVRINGKPVNPTSYLP